MGNDAATEIYNVAQDEMKAELVKMREQMDAVREESYAIGVLKTAESSITYNEVVKYTTLYRIKESKEYRNIGKTWKEFLDDLGYAQRTVDRILEDMKPVAEKFSANLADLIGLPFNKIRYLGRSVAEKSANLAENELVIDGHAIPLNPENRDEIEAAIDALIESNKKERQALKKELTRHKKQTDQIVAEETKSLTHERDALIKEVDRLKPLEAVERDREWCEAQFSELVQAMAGFSAAAHPLLQDQRMDGDRALQAEAYKFIVEAEGLLEDIRELWVDRFTRAEF